MNSGATSKMCTVLPTTPTSLADPSGHKSRYNTANVTSPIPLLLESPPELEIRDVCTGAALGGSNRKARKVTRTGVRYDCTSEFMGGVPDVQYGDKVITNLDTTYGEWRTVPGFPCGNIVVSDKGWVMTCSTHKWCKPTSGWSHLKTYNAIQLHGFQYLVTRMVCRAFHGPPPATESVVVHVGVDKTRNDASMLKWGTRSEARKGCNTTSKCNTATPVEMRHGSWDECVPTIKFDSCKQAAEWMGKTRQNWNSNTSLMYGLKFLEENPKVEFLASEAGRWLYGWHVKRWFDETQDDLPATDCDRLSGCNEPAEEWRLDVETEQLVSNRGRFWKTAGQGKVGKRTMYIDMNTGLSSMENGWHRIVYRAFHGELVRTTFVTHADGNFKNNNLSNLIARAPDDPSRKRRREELRGLRCQSDEPEWKFARGTDASSSDSKE